MITLPLMMTALVTLVFLAQDKACCYNLLQWLPPNNRHARACCSAPYRATSLCTPSEPWKLVVFFPRRIPSPWNRTITWRKANWHPWRIHRKKQICIGYPTYSIHSFIIFPMNIAMIGPFDKNSRVSCPSMSGEVEGGRRRRRSRSGRHHHKRQGPQGDTFTEFTAWHCHGIAMASMKIWHPSRARRREREACCGFLWAKKNRAMADLAGSLRQICTL